MAGYVTGIKYGTTASEDELCLGFGCPLKERCARVSLPRTKRHYTIIPYDKTRQYCRCFKKKEVCG